MGRAVSVEEVTEAIAVPPEPGYYEEEAGQPAPHASIPA